MATWLHHHNHHHHPWFASPSLKRKLSSEDQDQQLPHRKRIHKLERGFAGLALHNPPSPSSPSAPAPTPTPTPTPTRAPLPNVIHRPTSIDEPPEIKMSSWYELEKDRIVITHLDDSEEEEEGGHSGGGYTISPAILGVLNKRLGVDPPPLDIPETHSASASASAGRPSQALILFQSRDPLFHEESKHVENEVDKGTLEDEAMDIEML